MKTPAVKLAYIFVRFPKITETFNLREMLQLHSTYGVELEVFSLLRPIKGQKVHPEATSIASRTHYSPWLLNWQLLQANLDYIFKSPRKYFYLLSNIIFHTLRQPVTLLKSLAIFPKSVLFAHLTSRMNVDHIHATFASHNATCAMIMSVLTGTKFSFTIDAYDLYVETALLEKKIACADFVSTISNFNLDVIAHRYGTMAKANSHVVYRGVDLNRFKPPISPDNRHPKKNFTIVCVASLQPKKGHRYLIEAMSLLRKDNRRVQLVIAGDGPLRQQLGDKVKKLGLKEWITFMGDQTQGQVVELLQKADCFTLPSIISQGNRMEGIPNALMEAMACGLPVISTHISAIPELIEHNHNGLLVQPEDSSAISEAVSRLQEDTTLCSRLGQAGREKIAADFNQIYNTRKLWQLYGNHLSQR